MSTSRTVAVCLVFSASIASGAVGCGSSAEPVPHGSAILPSGPQGSSTASATTPPPDDAGPPPAPVRSMRSGSLLGTSPRNLLLDPSITPQQQGVLYWGHFGLTYDGSFTPLKLDTHPYSDTPAGIGVPVAFVKDASATDTRSRAMSLLSPFIDGPGPYRAQVWLSPSDLAGNPVDLPGDPAAAGATVLSSVGAVVKSYDLVLDPASTRVIGGRTWGAWRAKIDAALPGGGFFQIKLGRLGGQWRVTAPEIVPLSLDGAAPMKHERAAIAREASEDECAAIEGYGRSVRVGGGYREVTAPPR